MSRERRNTIGGEIQSAGGGGNPGKFGRIVAFEEEEDDDEDEEEDSIWDTDNVTLMTIVESDTRVSFRDLSLFLAHSCLYRGNLRTVRHTSDTTIDYGVAGRFPSSWHWRMTP